MIINKFYFIYLLYCGIYLTIAYPFDDDTTYIDDVSILLTSILPTTTISTSQTMISTESTVPPIYIITNFTTLATTIQSTQFASQMSTTITNERNPTSLASIVTTTIPLYNPDTCGNPNYIKLSNGTCVSKPDGQMIAAGILRNGSNNTTDTAIALSLYISSVTNSTSTPDQLYTLSLYEIDNVLDNMGNINLTINSNTSFVTIQQPNRGDNITVLGALFKRGIGGQLVDTTNRDNLTKSYISAAGIIHKESLNDAKSLNMLIIDIPFGYGDIDNSTNKTIASSIIMADLRKNNSMYNNSIFISLYFQPLYDYAQNSNGIYLCSFYDTNTSEWSEYGCSDAEYNTEYDRYECTCAHLTSFALIWLPKSSLTNNKQQDAQDIASLIFQCISIICFIAIIIHAITIRIINPLLGIQALNLLPLISTASTTILFIFYIALTMTVYTQTSSSTQTQCFLSSSVLMFFVYFLLIFMFCIKTSVGYFYYLRFVHLFPQPSHRKLIIMLIISFFISILCVAVAIGFNANSSYNITQLYPYKICWFTRNVIYYFMTIPIGIFIIFNIITITLVSKSIINHARHAVTPKQMNERMKRCIIILLSSCVTQGVGWLFGPFISFVNPIAGIVLAWIFIIFNGLEGVWSILLYMFIRSQRLDEQKHISAGIELSKSSGLSSNNDKNLDEKDVQVNLRKRETLGLSSDDDDDDKISN